MSKLIIKYAFAAMILANVIGGFGSVLVKIGLESITPFLFAGFYYSIAGAFFLTKAWLSGETTSNIRRKQLVISSVLQVVVGLTWMFALTLTQAINASIIYLLIPIQVYVGSVLFLGEPRSNKALTGSLVAFVGGVLMFGAPAINGSTNEELIGNGLLLISSIAGAALILQSKKVVTESNIFLVMGIRRFATGMVAFALAVAIETPADLFKSSNRSLIALLLAVIFASYLSTYLFFKALEQMRAEDSASLFYITPLVGSLASALILSETLSDAALIATGVIVMGVLISHPVHINRTMYYHKVRHSKFEEFVNWAKSEFDSASSLIKKYF